MRGKFLPLPLSHVVYFLDIISIKARVFTMCLIRAGFQAGLFILIPKVFFFSLFSQKSPSSFIFSIDFSVFVTFGGVGGHLNKLLLAFPTQLHYHIGTQVQSIVRVVLFEET